MATIKLANGIYFTGSTKTCKDILNQEQKVLNRERELEQIFEEREFESFFNYRLGQSKKLS